MVGAGQEGVGFRVAGNDVLVGGSGDGQADTVIVQGTNGEDLIQASGSATGVDVQGFAAMVHHTGAEAANDKLVLAAGAGDDVVEASGLAADAVELSVLGGDGDDILVGSAGDDPLFGSDGDDILIGGPGQDALDGGAGDNILLQ